MAAARTPRESTSVPPWQAFEVRVLTLLRAIGYQVSHNVDVGCRQTDVLATYTVAGQTYYTLIECKYRDRGAVGVREVEDFLSRTSNARNSGKADRGMLVTNTSFTRPAKTLISSHNATQFVQLSTPDSIIASYFSLNTYLDDFVDDYRSSDVSSYYVPLSGNLTAAAPLPLSFAADTSMSGRENSECEPTRHIIRPITIRNTESYVMKWVMDPASSLLCILGDYGTGKTTLCRKLAVALSAQRNHVNARIPIYLPLRNFFAAGSARALITDWLANECGVANARYSLFLSVIEASHFVLILDGFDEMVKSTDRSQISDCFAALAELNRPGAKTIIAGRPGYFPDLQGINSIAARIDERVRWQYARSTSQQNSRHIFLFPFIELQPFSARQVNKIIEMRTALITQHGYTPVQLRVKIREMRHLGELSTRPVLLDMIIQSFAELGPALFARNSAHLYEIYTTLLMNRERDKGTMRQSVSSEHRRNAMLGIAWRMLCDGHERVSDAELAEWLQQGQDIPRDLSADQLASDVASCTFLVRDRRGLLRFGHKSFMEYFAACRIAAGIRSNQWWVIEDFIISQEVVKFISEIIGDDKDANRSLCLHLEERGNVWVSAIGQSRREYGMPFDRSQFVDVANALRILTLCPEGTSSASMTGLPIVGAEFENHLDASDRNLDYMVIYESRFASIDVSGVKSELMMWASMNTSKLVARKACVSRSMWRNVTSVHTDCREATFVEMVITGCRIAKADLRQSRFTRCVFRDCVLTDANVARTEFVECEFLECDLRNIAFDTCLTVGCVFKSCAADQDEHRDQGVSQGVARDVAQMFERLID